MPKHVFTGEGIGTIAEFTAEIEETSKSEIKRLNKAFQDMAIDFLTRLVERTPIDRSDAKRGWTVTFEESSGEVNRWSDPIRTGTLKIRKFDLRKHDAIYISNGVEYMEVLEYGLFIPKNPGPSKDPRPHRKGKVWVKNGYSVQAPKGILRVTQAEIQKEYF